MKHKRIAFGIPGLDHILCPTAQWKSVTRARGAAVGSTIGIFGPPSVGRTTLMMHAACNLAEAGVSVWYHSLHEEIEDLTDCVRRNKISKKAEALVIVSSGAAEENVFYHQLLGDIVFIDGVDTMMENAIDLKRLCKIIRRANANDRTVVVSGSTPLLSLHLPKKLVHKLDTVLRLSRVDGFQNLLTLSVDVKNRFGTVDSKAIFRRRQDGLLDALGIAQ